MQTQYRLGTFFILVGLVLLALFVGSFLSNDVKTTYLLISFVALLAGFLLRRNRPSIDSGRFSSIRRASAASHQRREEKMNQKSKNNPKHP
jgi:hypothetical protein